MSAKQKNENYKKSLFLKIYYKEILLVLKKIKNNINLIHSSIFFRMFWIIWSELSVYMQCTLYKPDV